MEKKAPNGTIDRQVGFLGGRIDGLTASVQELNKRFEEHLKDHRGLWLWIVPTLFSAAVLILLIIQTLGGCGDG